jgi:hypothetical protein
MGIMSFPGVKSDRGVTLTPHPFMVPLIMKEQSYTSTPPMGLTVYKNLSAYTRMHFTFTFTNQDTPYIEKLKISFVHHVKYVFVMTDTKMTWRIHKEEIDGKAFSTCITVTPFSWLSD